MQEQTVWIGQEENDVLAGLPPAVRRHYFMAADESIGVRVEDFWHLLDLCGGAGWAVGGWRIAVIHHRQVTATNSLIPGRTPCANPWRGPMARFTPLSCAIITRRCRRSLSLTFACSLA